METGSRRVQIWLLDYGRDCGLEDAVAGVVDVGVGVGVLTHRSAVRQFCDAVIPAKLSQCSHIGNLTLTRCSFGVQVAAKEVKQKIKNHTFDCNERCNNKRSVEVKKCE